MLLNSRLAVAGETIGNIAHQWRQPLNRIGMILLKIQGSLHFKKELDKNELIVSLKESETVLEDMSKTIDLFLNFFAPQNKNEIFIVSDCIDSAINIIMDSLKKENISIVIDVDKTIKTNGLSNELSQVILNIISNSKYILLSRNIKNPQIKLKLKESVNNIIIELEDNGGGIKIEPIEKIFEPYISTKEAKNGTGLGLYIAKILVETKMFGTITAKNQNNGALFTISLPIQSIK